MGHHSRQVRSKCQGFELNLTKNQSLAIFHLPFFGETAKIIYVFIIMMIVSENSQFKSHVLQTTDIQSGYHTQLWSNYLTSTWHLVQDFSFSFHLHEVRCHRSLRVVIRFAHDRQKGIILWWLLQRWKQSLKMCGWWFGSHIGFLGSKPNLPFTTQCGVFWASQRWFCCLRWHC